MYVQSQDIDEYGIKITEIEALKPDTWQRLNEAQKISVLQEVENRISTFEKRPTAQVKAIDFSKSEYKELQQFNGAYNKKFNLIGISTDLLEKDSQASSYKVLQTLLHESFHAYQVHAVINPGFHENETEVKDWKEGFIDYALPSEKMGSYEKYKSNPLEKDANMYADSLTRPLQREHEHQKSLQQLESDKKPQYQWKFSQTTSELTLKDNLGRQARFFLPGMSQEDASRLKFNSIMIEKLLNQNNREQTVDSKSRKKHNHQRTKDDDYER